MSVSINVGRSFPGLCSERGTNIDCPGPGRPESRLRRLSREMRDDLKVYIYPRTREPECLHRGRRQDPAGAIKRQRVFARRTPSRLRGAAYLLSRHRGQTRHNREHGSKDVGQRIRAHRTH